MTSASIGVVPYLPLNDGTKMPAVGMGCWMGEVGGGERVGRMVEKALKVRRTCFSGWRTSELLMLLDVES